MLETIVLIKGDSTVDLGLMPDLHNLRTIFSQDETSSAHVLLISCESLPADLSAARVWGQACLKVLVTQCRIAVCLGFDNMGGGGD